MNAHQFAALTPSDHPPQVLLTRALVEGGQFHEWFVYLLDHEGRANEILTEDGGAAVTFPVLDVALYWLNGCQYKGAVTVDWATGDGTVN